MEPASPLNKPTPEKCFRPKVSIPNGKPRLPTHLLVRSTNPSTSPAAPLPSLARKAGLYDFLLAGYSNAEMTGRVKQEYPMMTQNLVELHSGQYSHLSTITQLPMDITQFQQTVMNVLISSMYPLKVAAAGVLDSKKDTIAHENAPNANKRQ